MIKELISSGITSQELKEKRLSAHEYSVKKVDNIKDLYLISKIRNKKCLDIIKNTMKRVRLCSEGNIDKFQIENILDDIFYVYNEIINAECVEYKQELESSLGFLQDGMDKERYKKSIKDVVRLVSFKKSEDMNNYIFKIQQGLKSIMKYDIKIEKALKQEQIDIDNSVDVKRNHYKGI